MKAVTKAKRRVTLSICGLGFMDESEVADVPEATTEQPLPSNIVEPHEIPLMQSHGSIDWRAFGTALAEQVAPLRNQKPMSLNGWRLIGN